MECSEAKSLALALINKHFSSCTLIRQRTHRLTAYTQLRNAVGFNGLVSSSYD